MRYFAELSYKGTSFHGWQVQPKKISVQQVLQEAFSTILRAPIEIVGCGRTDAGVHATQYYFHFDFEGDFPKAFTQRLNKYLPPGIAISSIFKTPEEAHARFDARYRAYTYRMIFRKDPFQKGLTYHYPYPHHPDFDKMQQAAQLLLQYKEFLPFCKSNSDAKTMVCEIFEARWQKNKNGREEWQFHIAANRFLRGMVRLIVGMCINVGTGKLSLDEVKNALEKQTRLPLDLSVPAEGLYLSEIRYDFI